VYNNLLTEHNFVETMGAPVVVQGTPVQGTVFGISDSNYNSPDQSFVRGERQESKCRDPFFAVLFYFNVAAIVITLIIFQNDARKVIDDTSSDGSYSGYVYVALICGAFSMLFSALMVILMMRIPSFLIKTSLIFVVLLSFVWAVFGFLTKNIIMGILGLIFFLLGVCYARAVWGRIPFATANLVTGCTAIRGNCGVIVITFFFEALAFAWTVLWCLACFAIFNRTYSCEEINGKQVCTSPNYGYLFLLLLSFYFTHQVIQNTIHVIVAGTVGTWWFSPSDAGCCSLGVLGSTFR
jgi:Plasma-membrane choline transporter